MENWKPIPFAPLYEVSDRGRVRSWVQRWCQERRAKPLMLRPGRHKLGYRNVSLSTGGAKKGYWVHRLVALVFHGEPPPGKKQVRHLDGNPGNNRASNLAWGTAIENGADTVRHGRSRPGARNGMAKLTDAIVSDIVRRVKSGERQVAVARTYGLCQSHVSRIISGEHWKHLQTVPA